MKTTIGTKIFGEAPAGPLPLKASEEILKNGAHVATLPSLSSRRCEMFVQSVANESGQIVDWHYMAGRNIILYLGDRAKVVEALRSRVDWLYELFLLDHGEEFYFKQEIREMLP